MPRGFIVVVLMLFSLVVSAQRVREELKPGHLSSASGVLVSNTVDLSNAVVSIGSTRDSLEARIDSIESIAASKYRSLKNKYDSVINMAAMRRSHLQQKIDTLQNLQLPTNKISATLDSLEAWKNAEIRTITSRVDSLTTALTNKIESLEFPLELQERASNLTSVIDKLDVSLPIDRQPVSFQKLELGRTVVTETLKIQSMRGLDIPNATSLLDGQVLQDAASVDIKSVDMGDIGNQMQGHQNLVSQVPKDIDGIAKMAEEQATNISAVTDVQKELGLVVKLTDMAGTLKDQEELKKLLTHEVQKQAVGHFAGKEQELKSAVDLISKYKRKFGNVNNLEELAALIKKRPNEMKGKPLIERIVPGIGFQLQKKDDLLFVDLNLYVGYRFTGKLTAGIGWNQRVSYNLNDNTFDSEPRIFGPRAYSEYKLWKGFLPRVEVETMNTFVPPYIKTSPADAGGREWVWGVFAGIKKDYKFFKKINGTAIVMFRLFDPHRKSPYADVLNARFGFEFPMKKKQAKK